MKLKKDRKEWKKDMGDDHSSSAERGDRGEEKRKQKRKGKVEGK